MNKSKLIVLSLMLVLLLIFAAGCGGSNTKPQQSAAQHEAQNHAQMSMPSGDPMPMMKDMDKSLQNMMKQVKAGQMMDAQKSAAEIATLADKVTPHMTDHALMDEMQKAAYDLRDIMNSAKVDQTVVENKMKAMQDVMARAMQNLESASHKH